MLWNIKHARGVTPPDLATHVERRLGFALSRFAGRIRRVNVFLADQNGPRGGIDKTCRIVVRLADGGDVVAEVSDVDWVIAVDRATTRIGHSTGRQLARRRAGRRLTGGGAASPTGVEGAAAW
ncbi:MAG: HPF/RaiA family ribosome-associated protein [Planctomycetota bacterium]